MELGYMKKLALHCTCVWIMAFICGIKTHSLLITSVENYNDTDKSKLKCSY